MDTSDPFSRIWAAFDTGQILPACAWCGRVWIDETWLLASPAVLAAVDRRYTFSHSSATRAPRLTPHQSTREGDSQ
jgi:hypothetical protein